jgi:hypothetical protein
MAAELTRLTHKIAIQLHLVAESCTICSSRSRLPVRELLDAPSYILRFWAISKYCLGDFEFTIMLIISRDITLEWGLALWAYERSHIWVVNVPGSNLGNESSYPDWFSCFPWAHPGSCWTLLMLNISNSYTQFWTERVCYLTCCRN